MTPAPDSAAALAPTLPALGVLMLDTRFPRPVGDIGNPDSFAFPVIYKTVPRARAETAVHHDALSLLPAFIEAAHALVAAGVSGITTSCGFLSLFQQHLTEALPVPVLTSSLMQLPLIARTLPAGRRSGILTICADSLSPEHLRAAGVAADTPVGGIPQDSEFRRVIFQDLPRLDQRKARDENVAAAQAMQARHPDLGALVLECTNMGPYAADIAAATGLPVYSIIDALRWFQAGLRPTAPADPR